MMLQILIGDALTQLRTLPAESVQCCVCSPPYWGLRDYGTAEWQDGNAGCDHLTQATDSTQNKGCNGGFGSPYREICGKCGAKRTDAQLGLEKTPEEYVGRMVEIFREVRRVLRKDGTLWLNLGSSYSGSTGGNTHAGFNERYFGKKFATDKQSWRRDRAACVPVAKASVSPREFGSSSDDVQPSSDNSCLNFAKFSHYVKAKDMVPIPWMVAMALQKDGWYLRQDIIWAKPNPMPESVTDRCTKAHEYIFLLTKSSRYFYDADAIKEKLAEEPHAPGNRLHRDKVSGPNDRNGHSQWETSMDKVWGANGNRNKRSVWTVTTQPYPEAHFATYPPDLIKPCILAGTSARGCCAKCGAPHERMVETTGGPPNNRFRDGLAGDCKTAHKSGTVAGSALSRLYAKHGYPEHKTIGWTPTCQCNAAITPCTVLDPFGGSGTTGAVALELGRKAVLIELNPKYAELIDQRCTTTIGLPF